jgi:hypothetical protein
VPDTPMSSCATPANLNDLRPIVQLARALIPQSVLSTRNRRVIALSRDPLTGEACEYVPSLIPAWGRCGGCFHEVRQRFDYDANGLATSFHAVAMRKVSRVIISQPDLAGFIFPG